MTQSSQILVSQWELGAKFETAVPDDLAEFLGKYVSVGQWVTVLEYGAKAMIAVCDPLWQSDFAKRKYEDDPRHYPLHHAIPTDLRIPATRIRLSSHLDPLDVGLEDAILRLRQRLSSLEDAAKVKPENEVAAGPLTHAQEQHAANLRRLTNAYQVLAGKQIRVKLTCQGQKHGDYEEIYLDLPSESP